MSLHEGKTPLLPVDPQRDLDPDQPVFRIRFTDEIFRDYKKRLWTCRVTGKSSLTYEEALVSEKQETAMKIQLFPQSLIKSMLRTIQYSMLSLKGLAGELFTKLQESWFEGIETYARKENSVFPWRITRIIDDGAGMMRYEIAWLGNDKGVVGHAV